MSLLPSLSSGSPAVAAALPSARFPRPERPADDHRRSAGRRAHRRPAAVARRPDGRLRAHDDGPAVGPAERGPLERAGGRRRRQGADRRRQVGEHAALVSGRPAHRVHLDPGRRGAGVSSRTPTAAASGRSPSSRWACSRRWCSRRTARGWRSCPTSIRVRGRGLQQARKEEIEKNPVKVRRLTRLLSGTGTSGARTCATTCSSRDVAGQAGRSTSRRAISTRRRRSRRTPRSRSRPTAGTSRSSRTARATTAKPGPPTTTCGRAGRPAAPRRS